MAVVKTTITNASGVTRRFDWFPPHGVVLAANGTAEVLGILENRLETPRDQAAYLACVTAGHITSVVTGL